MNTLWATLPTSVQERMISSYVDVIATDDNGDDVVNDARNALMAMDDDTLRDHLREGIGWEQVDEHDRWVDRPYVNEARDLEKEDRLGFMDMCHSVGYAMQAMKERIDQLTKEIEGWASTIHDYGALKPEARKEWDAMCLYRNRLKMSHDRLAELALQQGVFGGDAEALGFDDGMFATHQIDIWIRG